MSAHVIRRGGVIAAGEGRRLGGEVSKLLVEVAGSPLLAHTLNRYADAGLERVVVIVREQDRDVAAWVEQHFPHLDPRVLVKTTPASSVSFVEVVRALGPGRAVLSTVDTVCRLAAFRSFLRAAEQTDPECLVLGVTSRIDDEKPLWTSWDDEGVVTALGGKTGRGVTAGLYVVPSRIADLAGTLPEAPPLRALLAAWVASGRPTRAVEIGDVVDVDRPEDVRAAEAFLAGEGGAESPR